LKMASVCSAIIYICSKINQQHVALYKLTWVFAVIDVGFLRRIHQQLLARWLQTRPCLYRRQASSSSDINRIQWSTYICMRSLIHNTNDMTQPPCWLILGAVRTASSLQIN